MQIRRIKPLFLAPFVGFTRKAYIDHFILNKHLTPLVWALTLISVALNQTLVTIEKKGLLRPDSVFFNGQA